jgi:hypothetical protein
MADVSLLHEGEYSDKNEQHIHAVDECRWFGLLELQLIPLLRSYAWRSG